MRSKHLIYMALVFILVLSSSVLLLFYYTQDFEEDFNFKSSISVDEIQIESSGDYIKDITADIGELKLENKGMFTQVYTFPEIVGCVNLREGKTLPVRRIRVYLDYLSESQYPIGKDPLEIPVGKIVRFKVLGRYSPSYNSISLKELQSAIEGVTLYEISRKEPNPFDDYSSRYYGRDDCGRIEIENEPLQKINLV